MQEAQATPSPSTPSSRPWLSRLRRGLGMLLVLVLSLIGLLALLLHLVILPRIDSFRPALENLASRTLGAPILGTGETVGALSRPRLVRRFREVYE